MSRIEPNIPSELRDRTEVVAEPQIPIKNRRNPYVTRDMYTIKLTVHEQS